MPSSHAFKEFRAATLLLLISTLFSLTATVSAGVISWGQDNLGGLGLADTRDSNVPVELERPGVLAGQQVVAIARMINGCLMLTEDGKLYGWGAYPGNGSVSALDEPVAVFMGGALAGKTITAIAGGYNHYLVLTSEGQVYGWGLSGLGQLGQGNNEAHRVPVAIDGGALAGKVVTQIDSTAYTPVVLTSEGTLIAWGSNTYGQIGDGTTTSKTLPVNVDVSGVLKGVTLTKVGCGHAHVLAIDTAGQVYAWGDNRFGMLGDGTTQAKSLPVKVIQTEVMAGKVIVEVDGGAVHSLALSSDGKIYAWGSGVNATAPNWYKPVAVTMGAELYGKDVRSISAGAYISQALTTDGAVFCWGGNSLGEIGDGSNISRNTPTPICEQGYPGGNITTKLFCEGYSQTVSAITKNGRMFAWGRGQYGTFATGLYKGHQTEAHQVAVENSHADIGSMATGGYHSLVAYRTSVASPFFASWGDNSYGQLGNDSISSNPVTTPRRARLDYNSSTRPQQAAAGFSHSLMMTASGQVYAWGSNPEGQLGTGEATTGSTISFPALVGSGSGLAGRIATAIAAGSYHSLALTTDNKLFAWGRGFRGQLGSGGASRSSIPIAVNMTGALAGKTVTAIAAGGEHNLILTSDGKVFAWGANGSGQLGTGTTDNSPLPLAVDLSGLPAGDTVVQISAGATHSLLTTQTGLVYSWGSNEYGELGQGHNDSPKVTPAAMIVPEALAGKQVVKTQAGQLFSVLLTADGKAFTTGYNSSGRLGTGDLISRNVPSPIAESTAVANHVIQDIAAGSSSSHVLALAVPTSAESLVAIVDPYSWLPTTLHVADLSIKSFGRVQSSSSGRSLQVEVRNRGVAPLTGVAASISGPDASSFVITQAASATIAAGAKSVATLRFKPIQNRIHNAVLSIHTHESAEPLKVKLTGQGASAFTLPAPSSPQYLNPGAPLSLLVIPSGTGPFTYQWYKKEVGSQDNVVIAGATSRSFIIPAVTEADEATYTVNVQGDPFYPYSSSITQNTTYPISVNDGPTIAPPSSSVITAEVGSSPTLSFTVTGPGPFTYQWQKDGKPFTAPNQRNLGLRKVTPAQAGMYTLIATNSAGTSTSPPIRLIVDTDVAPVITKQPTFEIKFAGSPYTLETTVFGALPLKMQWFKDGAKISGATTQSRVFKTLKLADAGVYSLTCQNAKGTITSNEVPLVVIQRPPAVLRVKSGTLGTLQAIASAPPNYTLNYTWTRAGEPIEEPPPGISGLGTSTLTFTDMNEALEGTYGCLISITPPGEEGGYHYPQGETIVHIPQVPEIANFTVPDTFVGTPISYPVAATEYPTRYTLSSLPPGLKFDAASGIISGYATKPKLIDGEEVPYTFTVTATNSAGTSQTATGTLLVKALPSGFIGPYAGLIDRHELTNDNLGGNFKFTATGTGAVSGTITLAAKAYRFTSSVSHAPEEGEPAIAHVTTQIAAPSGLLDFTAILDLEEGTLTGTLHGGTFNVPLEGHRIPWTSSEKATAHAGAYNHAFSPTGDAAGDPAYPQGHGFAILTVTASGTANWAGTLADGTTFTFSSALGQQLRVPLHGIANKIGSILGWSDLGAGPVSPSMDWFKATPPAKPVARSYAAGIPLHDLLVTAARYQKPVAPNIVLGLSPVIAPATNALLTFSEDGLTIDFEQALTITGKNAVQMPAAASNPKAVKLTLVPATGRLSGSFTLKANDPRDTTEPYVQIQRTVKYQALLIPRADFNQGLGHFNLPEVPTTSAGTLNNTPMWSGKVELLKP